MPGYCRIRSSNCFRTSRSGCERVMMPPQLLREIDSRQYRFAYRLKAAADLPVDFPIAISPTEWRYAVFVPGDMSNRWGKPKFPPRIYVLTDTQLCIYNHPSTRRIPFTCTFENLIEVSCYRALLHGELKFCTEVLSSGSFYYGAVQHKYIDPLLRELRSVWLHVRDVPGSIDLKSLHTAIDHRCCVALQREVDSKEAVVEICYQPAFSQLSSRWFYTRKEEIAARTLAYTNRRLILIVEGQQERQEAYGIRIRSIAIQRLRAVQRQKDGSRTIFRFLFAGSLAWQLNVASENIARVEALLSTLCADSLTIDVSVAS